ncbi:MBL fold metallo-hydrolase [Salinibaculum salinum]|uniref:MBL fold metallo-hydrolase n=1 Tax=Salinibaculum salinum TaxID=3131996 RepID=UPI0030EBBF7B
MTPQQIPVSTNTRAPDGRTNAYVLGSDDALLVDPATLTDDLHDVISDRHVGHVAVTHHHPDHVGAVAEAARTFDLTVWARAGHEREFAAATGVDPDRTFSPGETLPVADGVPVVDTPGHASEHVAFVVDDGLVSGDLAVAEGSVVVGTPGGDMRAYLSSLRRVHARAPDNLYPGHGPVVDDPRATCSRLIAHRLQRERTVGRAVTEEGAMTPDDIVDAAYEKDVSAVRDLARATVVAHLEKLAIEGQVRWDGERASPV